MQIYTVHAKPVNCVCHQMTTMEFMPVGIKLELVLSVDDDVIHQAQNTGQVVKNLIHLPLKVLRDIGDTEGHLVKTMDILMG